MNKPLFLGAGILLALIAGVVWFFFPRTVRSPSPTAPERLLVEDNAATSSDAKAVPANPPNNPATHPLPLVKGDSIVSWDFKGAYTDNPELVAKAGSEIKRLSGLLATATSSAMVLLVGIANDYELLGKGKEQYEYLGRAVRANPENGLPWHNLGVLLERLGALETARIAYERSTLLQPQLSVYQYAYLEFLIQNMKDDTMGIEKAFSAAEASLGSDSYLAYLRDGLQKQ